jgi:hypothetical protein
MTTFQFPSADLHGAHQKSLLSDDPFGFKCKESETVTADSFVKCIPQEVTELNPSSATKRHKTCSRLSDCLRFFFKDLRALFSPSKSTLKKLKNLFLFLDKRMLLHMSRTHTERNLKIWFKGFYMDLLASICNHVPYDVIDRLMHSPVAEIKYFALFTGEFSSKIECTNSVEKSVVPKGDAALEQVLCDTVDAMKKTHNVSAESIVLAPKKSKFCVPTIHAAPASIDLATCRVPLETERDGLNSVIVRSALNDATFRFKGLK